MREMTGEQRCLIHSANRSLEWWDAVGGNVLGCVEARAIGTRPPSLRWQGFPRMRAQGRRFEQAVRDSVATVGSLAFFQAQGYRVAGRRREAAMRYATMLLAVVVVLVAAQACTGLVDFRTL